MRAALIRGDVAENIIEVGEGYEPPRGLRLRPLVDGELAGPGWRLHGDTWAAPDVPDLPPPVPDLQEWATSAQAELVAQRQILDLLLLGGLNDDGGTIDGEIGSDLPDSGGTLDDLEGLDLGNLPDSGETLDDLDLALEA